VVSGGAVSGNKKIWFASAENEEYREKREHRMKREKKSVRNELREKSKIFILGGPSSFFNRV
jgi:hypothetical protein